MASIARTKPNMSVLRRDILPVSPFGMLSQAFTDEILSRFESGLGFYPMYGLELLYPEEENAGEAPGGRNMHLEVQLKLILQQLKEQGETPAAERILKKAETIRLLREKTVVRRMPGTTGKRAASSRASAAADEKMCSPWMPDAAGGKTVFPQLSAAGRRPLTKESVPRIGGGAIGRTAYARTDAGFAWTYRQLGTYAGAATGGRYRPLGGAVPAAITDGQTGTRVVAETPPEAPGVWRTSAEVAQAHLQRKERWDQRAQTVPAISEIRHSAALMQMGSPTAEGLPGQMGESLARLEFLTPPEADVSGGQARDRKKTAAGLTRRMEQAAVQAADAVARAMAMLPPGTQADDYHRYVGQASSSAERKTPSSEHLRAGQLHREEKDVSGRDSGAAASHVPVGMQTDPTSAETPANHRFTDAMVSGEEMLGGISSAKGRTSIGSGVDQIGAVAKDIRMSGGGPIDSLPDMELTTNGAAGRGSAIRQNKITRTSGDVTAVPIYLPLSLEHTESAAMPEQTAIPGKGTSADETGRQFFQAIETAALGAERTLTRSMIDGRRQAVAERKSKARGESAGMQTGTAAPSGLRTAGAEDPDSGQLTRMGQPSTKGVVEKTETMALSAGRGRATAMQSTGNQLIVGNPAAGLMTPDHLPDQLPIIERLAANNPGVLGGLTMNEPISTERVRQLPLTLEHLQESQENDIQAAKQIPALPPKVLEKLLDTPGLRLLSKDIAVLAAESRQNRGIRQVPHHRSQTAQTEDAARGAVNGDAVYDRGTSGAAGNMAFAKPFVAGHSAFSQGKRPDGLPRSRNMGFPSVHASSAMTTGGMARLGAAAAAQSHTWSPAAQLPVELAHMEPSLEAAGAAFSGQAATRQETGAQQAALLKEIQRSIAGNRPGAVGSSQSVAQSQRELGQHAVNRERAASQARSGRRGFAARGPGQLTVVGHKGGFSRGGGTAFGTVSGAAAYGGMAQETLSSYPALSMEYGGPLVAMARELRQTVERESSQIGVARDMSLHTPAARAMEEKGTPETIQTLDVITQPQIQQQQVVWQNPYMRSAPSEMTHHQQSSQSKTQQSQPQVRMSDAEIRRTADKVFKLVQEKIIAERRRIGRI